jgi:glutathione S-transferase
MITLHHLENSQSIRILWLLEELNLEYQIKNYKRDKVTKLVPKEYKALHPLGTAPIIEHNGKFIAETNAIVDYLMDLKPDSSLCPDKTSDEYHDYRFWLHSSQGSLMPALLISYLFNMVKSKSPFFLKPIMGGVSAQVEKAFYGPRIHNYLRFMNDSLEGKTWLLGDKLSAADIVMSYTAFVAEARADISGYKNIERYIKEIKGNENFKLACEKSGGFSVAV